MFVCDQKSGTINMVGPVGFDDGFDHYQLIEALGKMGGRDISVRINSQGGDINHGFGIYNALREYPGRVAMHIDVQAYSIASVAMLAGDVITASSNASVMVHNAWTIAMGNAGEFRSMAEVLDLFDGQIADAYAERTGKTRAYWLDAMGKETYYSAEQAKRVGLIDQIAGQTTKAAAMAEPLAVAMDFPRRNRFEAEMLARRLRTRRAVR